MRTSIRTLMLGAAVAALAACVPLAPPDAVFISARFGPPPPRYEVVGYAPGPDFIWIRGYWDWEGVNYVWVPGRWERRPYPQAMWVPDRWRRSSQGWYRETGHWRGEDRGRGRGHDDDDRGRRDDR